ncbi:MAG TPA: hypothetical protein VHM91_16125 [Verrucomicrobiales bacterium]|nr:hypothetical protein [Verrucomicrobiales bacterium]
MSVPAENPSPPENPKSTDPPQEERSDPEANDPGVRIDRQQAVVDGFQSAFLRVILGVVFIGASVVFAILLSGSKKLLPGADFVPDDPLPEWIRWAISPLVWVGAAGATFALTVSDHDRKWRRLSTALFALFASAVLIPRVRWVDSVAVALGLLGVYCALQYVLKQKEAARQWVWEQEKQERESQKEQSGAPRQKLVDRYGGVAGFENDP